MIEEIAKIFEKIHGIKNWNLDLVKINVSKKNGVKYLVDELSNFDNDGITKTLQDVISLYTNGKESSRYTSIENYENDLKQNAIYKIPVTSELVKDNYELLIDSLASPEREEELVKNKYDCYILKGVLETENDDVSVKIVFMNNPIKVLKNSFWKIRDKYTEYTEKVICLSLSISMIIVDGQIYCFNNSCERFFNMERKFKAVCLESVESIKSIDIVSDIDMFSAVACSGHNPKRFLSFNKKCLEQLKNKDIRNKISKKFQIPLNGDKFDTTSEKAAEKLIKLLCGKGKLDPFDNKPVEVASAKEWE